MQEMAEKKIKFCDISQTNCIFFLILYVYILVRLGFRSMMLNATFNNISVI